MSNTSETATNAVTSAVLRGDDDRDDVDEDSEAVLLSFAGVMAHTLDVALSANALSVL
jgi:hypothetical protein